MATNNNLSNFLKIHESIATWGPDRLQTELLASTYAVEFSEAIFFEHLYVPLPVENKLYEMLNARLPGNLLAFCGPAGSGKSTVSLRVKKRLQENPRNLVLFFDMRYERSRKVHDDSDDAISDSTIREFILSRLRRLFEIDDAKTSRSNVGVRNFVSSNSHSRKEELVYFLLSSDNTETPAFDSFSSEIEEIRDLYRKQTRREQKLFSEWYWNTQYEDDVREIRRSVLNKIDLIHYIAFIKEKNLFDKVFIWLDNLDSFSNEQQIKISNFLHTTSKPIVNTCQVVVSVREENIFRIGDFHDSFTEPYVTKVTVGDPDVDSNITEYDALNVSVILERHLREIVRKKLDFTNIRCSNLVEKHGDLPIWPTEEEYESLLTTSDKILDCFSKEKVILLSNNSIREFLRIHAKFLRYLFRQDLPKTRRMRELSVHRLSTEFLGWLNTIDEPLRVNTFNIMHEVARFNAGFAPDGIGCFLPYLIMTRIWNECLRLRGKPSPANNPFLMDIVSDIEMDFKYDRTEILRTILDLYERAGRRSNFITFRKKRRIENVDGLSSLDSTVRITYRGKVTIGSVISSFGYLRECNERSAFNPEKSDIELQVIENIQTVAHIHLNSLQKIRDVTFRGSSNWFSIYLSRYGMPLEKDFVRISPTSGRKIAGFRETRVLFISSVLISMCYFFKYDKVHLPIIKKTLSRFNTYVEQLERGDTISEFSFEDD